MQYRVGVTKFVTDDGKVRALLLDRKTAQPSIIGSIFESSQSRQTSSYNSLVSALGGLAVLLSWAAENGVDVERRLLQGLPLNPREIDRFCIWLEGRLQNSAVCLTPSNIRTFNGQITQVRRACEWFVLQFLAASNPNDRAQEVAAAKEYMSVQWNLNRKRDISSDCAPVLTDDEISEIEQFLRASAQGPNASLRWIRAYLIWRLAIEIGFRIGEILALRVEDCPSRFSNTFDIVRIEKRNNNFPDPRGD